MKCFNTEVAEIAEKSNYLGVLCELCVEKGLRGLVFRMI